MGGKELFALRREALSVRAERAERRAKTASVLESRLAEAASCAENRPARWV